MKKSMISLIGLVLLLSLSVVSAQDEAIKATPGQTVNMILLPKFVGIA